jgi:hypothetical protein
VVAAVSGQRASRAAVAAIGGGSRAAVAAIGGGRRPAVARSAAIGG